jgi:uncharacterized Zn finger protein (UPF0148 family)
MIDEYKLLKKILGGKQCPECGKDLKVTGGIAYCSKCSFEAELKYKDKKRNKDQIEKIQFRKIEDLIELVE